MCANLAVLYRGNDNCFTETERTSFLLPLPPLGVLNVVSNPIMDCVMDLPATACDRVAWFCTLVLVSAPFVQLLREKKLVIKKKTYTVRLWSFPGEIVHRSRETVGSVLLEIVIMLMLWYSGNWGSALRLLILRAVMGRKRNLDYAMADAEEIISCQSDFRAAFSFFFFNLIKSEMKPSFRALIDPKSSDHFSAPEEGNESG